LKEKSVKDSTLIILGLTVACLCGGYLTYYAWISRKRRFDRYFHNHNMFKSTLAMAAGVGGGIALLVVIAGVVNGGMLAVHQALVVLSWR
jgi:flagellar basal body-associated protein FliL